MRWDSPLVLALGGTFAIHLLLITIGDAIITTHPFRPDPPTPHIELVDIEMPAVVTPPPEPEPETRAVEPTRVIEQRRVETRTRTTPTRVTEPVTPTELPPTTTDSPKAAGGEQVVAMEDIAPAATGVGVLKAKPTGERIGRGGAGGGTGRGSGSGSAPEELPTPAPVSVATIKTPAKPRGDYGYFDAGKDYPAEARQLAIEGVIKVKLVVDNHGKVKRSVLLTHLGHGLDELALSRASKIEFEAARDSDDTPVASVVIWTFNMTLPK